MYRNLIQIKLKPEMNINVSLKTLPNTVFKI